MARISDVIADALVAEIKGRSEWDEPPALYSVRVRTGREPVCELMKFPLPDAIWSLDRPPYLLARMADGFAEFGALLIPYAPPDLYGAAFRCESWMVKAGPPGSPGRKEMIAASRAKTIHLRSDRIEARTMYAVDRAGITYGAALSRGETEVQRQIAYPAPGKEGFSGTVPNALDRLVTALLGVSVPPRRPIEED